MSLQVCSSHRCTFATANRDAVSSPAHAQLKTRNAVFTLLIARACERTLLTVLVSLARKCRLIPPRLVTKESAARIGIQKRGKSHVNKEEKHGADLGVRTSVHGA